MVLEEKKQRSQVENVPDPLSKKICILLKAKEKYHRKTV